MAINLNDNIAVLGAKPTDARYLDNLTPYASVGAAESAIAANKRYTGLTVNIDGEEYWFKDGIDNGDLVAKALGGTSNLSGATNGLKLVCSNTYVALGGALTENTAICGPYSLSLGNYVSGLTAISAVTPTFQISDEGVNSSLSWCHDQDTPHFDVCLFGDNANSNADIVLDVDVSQGCFTVNTAPNTTCCSALSLKSTDSDVAIYNVHSSNNVSHYVKEACIASTKMTCESITDSSNAALNIKSVMNYDTRSWEFCKDNAVILSVLSGGTARYGSNVTLTNDCDLAHKWYVDNATGALSANNGLTKDGNNIVLGGGLTGATTVSGTTTDSLRLQQVNASDSAYIMFNGEDIIDIKTFSDTNFGNSETGLQVGQEYFRLTASDNSNTQVMEFCATDGTMVVQDTINSKGLVYDNDYENNFTARSLVTAQYVTGVTSGVTGAFTTANNGLCSSGQVVSLGGTLTGNTTIAGDNNIMTFNGLNGFDVTSVSATTCGTSSLLLRSPIFNLHNGVDNVISVSTSCKILTDTSNSEGFVYAGNYCTNGKINPRWIPDNAYVTGLTSGFFNTASNGLTKDLQDVKLGGTLCEATNICLGGGASTNAFTIENSGVTACNVFNMNGTTVDMCASNVNSPNQTGRVAVASSAALMCHGFTNCFSCLNMSNSLVNLTFCGGSSNAQFTVTDDTTNQRGIEYAACYHGTYSDRSLVDKEYVVSQTSGITANAITGASNGLCKIGQNVVLGGNLTGTTTICTCSNDFTIRGQDSNSEFGFFDNDAISSGWNIENCVGDYETTAIFATCESGNFASSIIEACDTASDCKAVLRIQSFGAKLMYFTGSTSAALLLDGTSSRFTDTYREQGLIYGGDYEDNFVPRSLVTAQYVTGITSGITGAFTSANNGICANGQTISLGGTLTGDTTIGGENHAINLGSLASPLTTTYVVANQMCVEDADQNSYIDFAIDTGNTYVDMYVYDGGSCDAEFYFDPTALGYWAYTDSGSTSFDVGTGNGSFTIANGINVDNNTFCYRKEGRIGTNNLNQFFCEELALESDASDNIMFKGDHDTKSFCFEINCSRKLQILSGGTARYLSSIGATGITDNSDLTNKCYVDTCVTSATSGITSNAITSASNGLCKVGQEVVLGGDLTGETTIGGAQTLKFNVSCVDISGETHLNNTTYLNSAVTGDINTDEVVVVASDGQIKKITGSSLNVTASNGLTASNNDVKLGGILTEETVISGGTQTLRFGHSSSNLQNLYVDASNAIQLQSSTIYTNATTSANYKGGNFCMQLDNTNATFCDNSTGKDGLKYASCISTGFTDTCSLVDKGYVDDNANILEVCQISSGYTTVRSDDLIVVSGISTNEINLYATPELGQRLTVVDICGNALAEPIVVNGNGNLINNSACSSINTDYGSVTYVFNGIFWSAVAFIN